MTSKTKKYLLLTFVLLTLITIAFCSWVFQLNHQINESLRTSWFIPPLEIYAKPPTVAPGLSINIKHVEASLIQLGFRKRSPSQALFIKDYKALSQPQCSELGGNDDPDITSCILFKSKYRSSEATYSIFWDSEGVVLDTFINHQPQEKFQLPAHLFAQFYGNEPVLRHLVKLEDYPIYCLQAVTSIEDHMFLEHEGISLTGMLRAVWDLLRTGHFKSGGSTITQQLVKNFFLTHERTLKRKVTEVIMAVLLEKKLTKEQILENYLNIIYMGQKGPFQVRGFSAAASHYYKKDIRALSVSECSLLAGLLNSPGRFNPFSHPDISKKRRSKVLSDMLKHGYIDKIEFKSANNYPLPKKSSAPTYPTAPYYVDAVKKELKKIGLKNTYGLKVYTSLDPKAQTLAQKSVKLGLNHLKKRFKRIKKLDDEEQKQLQALLININLKTNEVQALIGGNNYKKTQYNRATDSHRQVGSIMKPLVYLAALEGLDENGDNYHPLTLINDAPFTHKYEGQKWSPKNYSKKYWGPIPMYFALKNSINVSTAKIGLQVGLENIIGVARRLGVTSELKTVPSLTLGAFELYPLELAQVYSTIGRFGRFLPVHLVNKVTTLNDKTLYEFKGEEEQVVTKQSLAVLTGMLKQTLISGTAKSAKAWGYKGIAAGKTGTTSDSKDAWFAGFTPDALTIVWVGYDDNTSHNLTGASAALPIWSLFMKGLTPQGEPEDFIWPEGTTKNYVYKEDLLNLSPQLDEEKIQDAELIYR